MKATPKDSIALIFLPLVLCFMRVIADGGARTSAKLNGPFINNHKSQLIAFDSKGGEIEVSTYRFAAERKRIEIFFRA